MPTVVSVTNVSAATTATLAVGPASVTVGQTSVTAPGSVCLVATSPAETTVKGSGCRCCALCVAPGCILGPFYACML